MEQNKIFTIAICAYNAESRIRRAIESVLRQYRYMELVKKFLLVDNNSTDKTKEIIDEYVKVNENIEYVFEPRQGLSYARLAAVLKTESKWIIFVDDDNILQKQWLDLASKYIQSRKDVGVFNGAIIPYIEETLNSKQKIILEETYKNLACTHLNEDQIDTSELLHPMGIPIGAGMVARTKLLQDLRREGWTKLSDRRGESLSSGGDIEISLYIKHRGYEYGYFPHMIIKHLIPLSRLTEEYIFKLIEGSTISCFQLRDELDFDSIFILKLKAFAKFILAKMSFTKKSYFKWRLRFYQSQVLIKCIQERNHKKGER